MGYIHSTIEAAKRLIEKHGVKSVCDLGDQINYTRQDPKYVSEWYKIFGVEYMSIDLNGLNDSKKWNLDEPLKTNKKFDLVVDAGVTEHCKDPFMVFWNVDKLTKVGGYMLHENPRTMNWPEHGYHYFDEKFYVDLAIQAPYEILELKNTVSGGNPHTGNNVFCLLRKKEDGFIDREQFPKTYSK